MIPEGKTVKVFYKLTQEGQKDSILKGGSGAETQSFEVPATERLIKMSRVDKDGNLLFETLVPAIEYTHKRIYSDKVSFVDYDKIIGVRISPHWGNNSAEKFDKVQTIDSIMKLYDDLEAKKEDMEDAIPELNETAYKKFLYVEEAAEKQHKEAIAFDEKNRREAKERENAQKKIQKAYEDSKTSWIKEHGSQYLKNCLELGLKANKNYVLERAAFEHPGYVVDYNDSATWESRLSPSKEAVKELKELRAKGLEADVVWLTSAVLDNNSEDTEEDNEEDSDYEDNNYEENAYFQKCEAIVIYKYLDYYDLVKIL